ncbi:MAG TPA: AhpC/TSA family protein [Paludibacteraceae bacterium]|nr:AhpC/TSA family protein [Paludibacteraceae bacterium]HPH63105.1 AhpC/TSA family protein [Paludibacteraceae bacterium]
MDKYGMGRCVMLLCISLFFIVLFSCKGKDSYVIHGDLRCVNASKVYLLKQNELGELVKIDSTTVNGGEFKFHGRVDFPTMMYVQVGKRRPIDVFVENQRISITGSILLPDEIKVEGSVSHDDFTYLQNEMLKLKGEGNSLLIDMTNAKKQNDFDKLKSLSAEYNHITDTLFVMTEQFVTTNPTSVGAAYFVCMLVPDFDINELRNIIQSFDPSIAESEYVKFLNEELMLNQKMSLDTPAPSFKIPTSNGDSISLEDYKGEYVFIDFWASWCEPCVARRESMNAMYQKYKRSGFNVLSISLDKDANEWHKALSNRYYEWVEASDLLYWESPVSKIFRVQRIPYGVLIDPDGKIIAINPRRYIINAKLVNIFGY